MSGPAPVAPPVAHVTPPVAPPVAPATRTADPADVKEAARKMAEKMGFTFSGGTKQRGGGPNDDDKIAHLDFFIHAMFSKVNYSETEKSWFTQIIDD